MLSFLKKLDHSAENRGGSILDKCTIAFSSTFMIFVAMGSWKETECYRKVDEILYWGQRGESD